MARATVHSKKVCQICAQQKKDGELIPVSMIRKSILAVIKKDHPDLADDGYICMDDYRHYREEHIQDMLEAEKGQLSDLDIEVVNSIKDKELLTKNINDEFNKDLTFGERVSDAIAEFGGSWKFIISFGVLIILWIVINASALLSESFDPYPFILLNLLLSCLAALQAPIIMMSQNRQEAKDRMRAEHDYQVNLKAEMEIRNQNEKIEIFMREWTKLIELQDMELELLEEILQLKNEASSK
jgi:uncharacterized membrane protein